MDVGESSTARPRAEQGDTVDDERRCVIELSPDKTKHWIPVCDQALKPRIGRRFHTLDEAIACYMEYPAVCGFQVRHSTVHRVGNVVRLKYLVCKREGAKNGANSKGLRVTKASERVGCRARVVFVKDGGYVVRVFEERHTHNMIPNLSKQVPKLKGNVDGDVNEQSEILQTRNMMPDLSKQVSKSNGNVGVVVDEQSAEIDERKIMIGHLYSEVYAILRIIENDTTRLKEFAGFIKEYKASLMAHVDGKNSAASTRDLVEESVGVSVPSQGKVLQPDQTINKGGDGQNSGHNLVKKFVGISVEFVGDRVHCEGKLLQFDQTVINKGSVESLKGGKVKQMEKSERPKRKCRECMQYAAHDCRNCKRIMLEEKRQEELAKQAKEEQWET